MRNYWSYVRNLFDDDGLFKDFPYPFRRFWVDPVNGSDSNDGTSRTNAKTTLKAAYDLCTAGQHDTVILIGNGAASGSARLSANFAWAKNATHLLGICGPSIRSQRARIAPTTGIAGFANFFTVTGSGCYFKNTQFWHGFTTGVANSICMHLNNCNYNYFEDCHFAGMGDAESAADAGSRALKITGSGGDHEFHNCTFGVDTVARTALNALIEFTGNTPRNRFVNCGFDAWTTTVQTQLDILCAGAAAMDRQQLFQYCRFWNATKSAGYLAQTAVASCVAGQNGVILFKDCTLIGRTGFGKDATTRGFLYIDGGAPTAGTSGIAVAPTA